MYQDDKYLVFIWGRGREIFADIEELFLKVIFLLYEKICEVHEYELYDCI